MRLTNDDRVKSAPAWSPDGRSIAFLSAEDGVYGSPQLAIVPASGGEPRILTAGLDRWVNSFRYSHDGEWIYFLFENDGGGHLARVRPRDGKLEQAAQRPVPRDRIRRRAGSGDGRRAHRKRQRRGGALSARKGRPPRRLTDVNDAYLRSVQVGDKERIEFKSPDGTLIEAFVTKPPGLRSRATVSHDPGHPRRAGQPLCVRLRLQPQYLAANGYVVVEPNPRGSTGRDQAFVRAIYQHLGDHGLRRPHRRHRPRHRPRLRRSRPARVTGYSYGGYMTNTVITRTRPLQGRGLGRRAQHYRRQLRSRHLPEVVQLGTRRPRGRTARNTSGFRR